MAFKIITKNKNANYRYTFIYNYEAGIVLSGSEVKYIRKNEIDLRDSYVVFRNEEAFLINAKINKYKFNTDPNYNDSATRKLLLNKKEIFRIIRKKNEKKLQVIPVKMYWKNNKIKVDVGLGKPKTLHDRKREIQKRDLDREMNRNLKFK